MLREQRVGDDVSTEQVIRGHIHAIPIRRHAEQDSLMLQGTDEALVPRALRVTEDLPQFVDVEDRARESHSLLAMVASAVRTS